MTGLACPYCRTRSARIETEGYSQDGSLPVHDARALGLWRTRTIGICDRCGERWGLGSSGIPSPCPECGSTDSGSFAYGVQRNCWACGAVWLSPPPPKDPTRLDRLLKAVETTAILGFGIAVLGIGLFWLSLGLVFVIVAPWLLIPVGLVFLVVAFFYLCSRPKKNEAA